jgi:predicted nucleic acid-binding protein
MTFVVDASVVVKWVIPEVLSDRAEALRARADRLVAPDLLPTEVANVLWKKVLRRELSVREAGQALDLVMASGLDLRPSVPLLRRALSLAHRLKHPVYDCIYLALGQSEGATVVTADERLLMRLGRRRARHAVVGLASI